MPTETVYGLAANALDTDAVKKIFAAKGRPPDNPLIVHIAEFDDIYNLVENVPEKAKKLADAFWPGPLTVVLKKKPAIPDIVSGGLDTVAVRMPSHPTARELIKKSGLPLAAPSANISGKPSPTIWQHVSEDMDGRIEAVIEGDISELGVESTVITLDTEPPRLLRPGMISAEQMEAIIGGIAIDEGVFEEVPAEKKAASPGMKHRHYSPKADLTVVRGDYEKFKKVLEQHAADGVFALVFAGEENGLPVKAMTYGKKDDSASQAKDLFFALRELDKRGAKKIYARCPAEDEKGAGLAVQNRLFRAAGFNFI